MSALKYTVAGVVAAAAVFAALRNTQEERKESESVGDSVSKTAGKLHRLVTHGEPRTVVALSAVWTFVGVAAVMVILCARTATPRGTSVLEGASGDPSIDTCYQLLVPQSTIDSSAAAAATATATAPTAGITESTQPEAGGGSASMHVPQGSLLWSVEGVAATRCAIGRALWNPDVVPSPSRFFEDVMNGWLEALDEGGWLAVIFLLGAPFCLALIAIVRLMAIPVLYILAIAPRFVASLVRIAMQGCGGFLDGSIFLLLACELAFVAVTTPLAAMVCVGALRRLGRAVQSGGGGSASTQVEADS